jgi:hypothetical protein
LTGSNPVGYISVLKKPRRDAVFRFLALEREGVVYPMDVARPLPRGTFFGRTASLRRGALGSAPDRARIATSTCTKRRISACCSTAATASTPPTRTDARLHRLRSHADRSHQASATVGALMIT